MYTCMIVPNSRDQKAWGCWTIKINKVPLLTALLRVVTVVLEYFEHNQLCWSYICMQLHLLMLKSSVKCLTHLCGRSVVEDNGQKIYYGTEHT